MRSEDWKPIWTVENRLPSFVTNENLKDEFRRKEMEEFSVGASLYAKYLLLPGICVDVDTIGGEIHLQ